MGVGIFVRLTEWYRDTTREESGKTHVQPPAIERVGSALSRGQIGFLKAGAFIAETSLNGADP